MKNRRQKHKGQFVMLSHYFLESEAWRNLKPGPRSLYIELKYFYNGYNNGRLYLSHRVAADRLNVHRNTIKRYFKELEDLGFIQKVEAHCLGPSGFGQAAKWALDEYPLSEGEVAPKRYMRWKEQNPLIDTVLR